MGAGLGDRNKCDLGGERLGKLKTRDRFGCQLRAVGCDQNMLEHWSLPSGRLISIEFTAQYQLGKRPSKWAGVAVRRWDEETDKHCAPVAWSHACALELTAPIMRLRLGLLKLLSKNLK